LVKIPRKRVNLQLQYNILILIPDEAMSYLVEQVLELKSVEETRDSIILHDPSFDSSSSASLNRFILNEKMCGCG